MNDPFIGAAVCNYGAMPTDLAAIARIRAPVLAIFGADDRYITARDIYDFETAMDNAHKSVQIKVYQHAGEGFENSDNKLNYKEGAAEDAWQRTISFLDQHLK